MLTFIVERLRNALLEQGFRYDVVDAVVAVQGSNPAPAARAVKELSSWVRRPDWAAILPAYARCVRITRDLSQVYPVSPERFVEPAGRGPCMARVQRCRNMVRRPSSVDDFLQAFLPLIPVINTFFDKVLVMAEDETLRLNRLGLVQSIAALADGVADMGRLEGFYQRSTG